MMNLRAGYRIVRAEAGHLPFLNDIEAAAATIFPSGFLSEQILRDTMPLPILREAMEQSRLWVALFADEEPVGYALWKIIDDRALLAQVDVHPDHGRKGLGAELVRRVIGDIRTTQRSAIYLTTFSDVSWNAPFYAKCGFEELPGHKQPEFIKSILQEEGNLGLRNRVAMRYQCATREVNG